MNMAWNSDQDFFADVDSISEFFDDMTLVNTDRMLKKTDKKVAKQYSCSRPYYESDSDHEDNGLETSISENQDSRAPSNIEHLRRLDEVGLQVKSVTGNCYSNEVLEKMWKSSTNENIDVDIQPNGMVFTKKYNFVTDVENTKPTITDSPTADKGASKNLLKKQKETIAMVLEKNAKLLKGALKNQEDSPENKLDEPEKVDTKENICRFSLPITGNYKNYYTGKNIEKTNLAVVNVKNGNESTDFQPKFTSYDYSDSLSSYNDNYELSEEQLISSNSLHGAHQKYCNAYKATRKDFDVGSKSDFPPLS